ncbi:MAG: His/Gly/Thr/Pro-type tRNA ligase C-terminal domain-containing protein, partial [Firmicutes bacterium]|nr:His/Gly/Thr/Pro-type tRNA ligase C-terminal domain-containing protein [Bacillota bacterium]
IIHLVEEQNPALFRAPQATLFVAYTPEQLAYAFGVATQLRASGIATEIDTTGRSLKAQFKHADRLGAKFVITLGDTEAKSGVVTLRNMETKKEQVVKMDQLASLLK